MVSVRWLFLVALASHLTGSHAFLPSQSLVASTTLKRVPFASSRAVTTTSLSERRWNFNEGQGPFGLKKNAEVWNGRVAQMCFIFVFAQELITGKGAVEGIAEGNTVNLAFLGATVVSILGLTLFLAIKGKDDFVDQTLRRK